MTKPGQPVVNLAYDPLGRLWQVWSTTGVTQFMYDGDALVLEYDGSGNLLDRYVHGSNAAADDPLIWYAGATASSATRHWLHADHLGSIVAITNGSGGGAMIDSYDEYGIPGAGNDGRFGYTGQAYLYEIGLDYYKARIYSPTLGRFLQTDPIGPVDSPNLYQYVLNDPVNNVDPTGLTEDKGAHPGADCRPWDRNYCIIITGERNSGGGGVDVGSIGMLPGFQNVPFALNSPRDVFRINGLPVDDGQNTCSRPATASTMNDATTFALQLIDQNGSRQTTPLTSEFSRYSGNMDFSGAGWRAVFSEHSKAAYEHDLPGSSGMVLKVYVGDSSFGGANTATITPPTYSLPHVFEQIGYFAGMGVNAGNANDFLNSQGKCS